MKRKSILHYKLVKKIGQGGMGVVYLAWDTRLERKVAIKFLPPGIDSDSENCERFKIEAKAAAGLSHPNITTIYAIEEAGDEMFIVMEYIKGKELKEILEKKQLSSHEITHIATQIADGLEAAHKKKIVHRDIKSANIMVTESGRVKIMDFGLAKLGMGIQKTREQSTSGTASYMAPEQIKGENIDHRTDIWSFGVILYEMLNRRLPFRGDYEQAVFYSILNEEPDAIEGRNSEWDELLVGMVQKCLKKDSAERYIGCSQILEEMKTVNTNDSKIYKTGSFSLQPLKMKIIFGVLAIILFFLAGYFFVNIQKGSNNTGIHPPVSMEKSRPEQLAILPFTNLKNDPDTNFLGYAMADQVIGSLTYIKNISVRPSSAIRKYEKKVVDIKAAGKELRVDYILTGSYLKQDDTIRLNIELVNIKSNELLWRDHFEVEYENAFTLQDTVSEKVVKGFKLQFSDSEKEMMQGNAPGSPLAYEYYLRGVSFPSTIEGSRMAINMLKKSIELDPLYAPAYSELGYRLHQIAMFDPGETDRFGEAEKALLKALAMNKNLLDALGNLAGMYTDIGEIEKAVELLRRSLKVNPNNANTHFFLGYAYRYAGVLDEAIQEMEKALELDPKNPRFRSIGTTYAYLGEYEKALKAFELDGGSPFSLAWQGQMYLRMNQKEKALEYIQRALDIEPDSKLGLWAGGMKAHLTGDEELGLEIIRKSIEYGSSDSEQMYHKANILALLGDVEGTVTRLRKSVEKGFICYPLFLSDSFLDPIRDNPEFKEILKRVRKKHLAFKQRFF